jgi:starch synthase (maltosyl-transferring)
MEVIHNGIDLGRVPAFDLDRRRARRAAGLDPDRRLVAQVGRLEPQKDVPTYLAAAARIAARAPDVDFLVVGEGALRAGLEALADRLGIAARVRFTGVRDDVPALLAGVDVLVLASRYEGLPNVVIEAMATGAVVVCTDVGGARELVVPEQTGSLVPIERPDAIADAVLGVLAAPARADALARAARRRVEERFTVEAMARRTVAAYEELLHAPSAAVPAPRPA